MLKNNIFVILLEQIILKEYNIGVVDDENKLYFIAHDGGLTENQNEAFIFIDNEAMKLKAKEFIKKYNDLGYKIVYIDYKIKEEK